MNDAEKRVKGDEEKMKMIQGKYACAKVYTDNIEPEAIEQVRQLTSAKAAQGQQIAIMPDVHAGKGCTIGTVMTIQDRVVPNLVGVDIGCGVYAYHIGPKDMEINFKLLQTGIECFIPSGSKIREYADPNIRVIGKELVKSMYAPVYSNLSYHVKSLGTLGGGNHFISIEVGETGTYLLIHTGSRNLGAVTAKYHQEIAKTKNKKRDNSEIIQKLKEEGRASEISQVLANLPPRENDDLAYLEGQDMENYLHDMKMAQQFAHLNRESIAFNLCFYMGWEVSQEKNVFSVHNYIDTDKKILRKGAVAAEEGKPFLVPLNMRDGTLIFRADEARPDWLFSAPHGAGRAMSRTKAKKMLKMDMFSEQMKGIWSDSVVEATLDEAPGAYKPAEEIKNILQGTYTLVDHLIPVFNFKAKE